MRDIVYKLPAEFIERLKKIYPKSYPRICESFASSGNHTFRINFLKTDLRDLREALNRDGVKYRELPWPKGSFSLESDIRDLQKTDTYKNGLIYVQNISSMIPPVLLDPRENEKILDLCAAPGAKTSQIASLAAGKSIELVAIEKIPVRFYKLQATLQLQGVDCAERIMMDGIAAKNRFPGYFDKVLLDAPCSCEGRFDLHDPSSYKYWKVRKIKEMAHKQRGLLFSAVSCLRTGGEMIYSTCTFAPEENEEILDWALRKFETLEIVPLELPLSNISSGMTAWEGKTYSPAVKYALRVIPHDMMEGFFIAKLRKK
ncbi:MAG: RsmB/NOP family class I SAM-dependent RNA methyltransferase [Candidatus Omnitrophica bacterium]|nr:RsmB/NOP family class I SAM-dependent RNA methyltransferase [Candidatus Omnitrophota bacterium]